jgi:hypothetical protein
MTTERPADGIRVMDYDFCDSPHIAQRHLPGRATHANCSKNPAGQVSNWSANAMKGIVTLTNNRCYRSSTQSRSCRSGDIAPRLHGAGSERPVRLG